MLIFKATIKRKLNGKQLKQNTVQPNCQKQHAETTSKNFKNPLYDKNNKNL